MIKRSVMSLIQQKIHQGKVIVLYGARQVGKTTICKEILKEHPNSLYISCDDPATIAQIQDISSSDAVRMFGVYDVVVIDEAQRVSNIWLSLKIMQEHLDTTQIIATWSSSFDLANNIQEPLTGRKYVFHIHPLSLSEMSDHLWWRQAQQDLESRVIMGMYPEIVVNDSVMDLRMVWESYLYQDILAHQDIRKPKSLQVLLQALALQIGQQISYNELAGLVWVDTHTIIKYIELLKQTFIIFELWSYARNLRNELKKSKKIYFWDTGLRNVLIQNTNKKSLRNDRWHLRENFVIAERMKHLDNQQTRYQSYFWRTQTQQEIDYVESQWDQLAAYEIKRSIPKKYRHPKRFVQNYPEATLGLISSNNIWDFVSL